MIQSQETFIIASLTQSSKTSDVKSFWPGDGALLSVISIQRSPSVGSGSNIT